MLDSTPVHSQIVNSSNWSALNVTVIESIIKNLETLPASKLVEVAHFITVGDN